MLPNTVKTVVTVLFIGLSVCWLLVGVVVLVRQRHKDRQWQQRWEAQRRQWARETRINQRVSELLAQEYEQLLTPEEHQRREAQHQHLAALRAQAEAEITAEESPPGRP
jgi:biopolymer transport protein ExbB/TolQ